VSTRAFAPTPASAELVGGATIELDDEESHYLIKVRRVRVGERFELIDPRGGIRDATLVRVGRRVEVCVGDLLPRPEPDERVLLLGLPDPAATLEALTGASEAGASEIVLVRCARSQGRAPAAARVERVLRAAQRQCGRARAPSIRGLDEPWPLARALEHRAELPGWFAWEELSGSPGAIVEVEGGLRLLVGPEGGFTAAEAEQIAAAGLRAVSLGPWILRTPTAAVALLARAWARAAAGEGRADALDARE